MRDVSITPRWNIGNQTYGVLSARHAVRNSLRGRCYLFGRWEEGGSYEIGTCGIQRTCRFARDLTAWLWLHRCISRQASLKAVGDSISTVVRSRCGIIIVVAPIVARNTVLGGWPSGPCNSLEVCFRSRGGPGASHA